MLLCSFKPQWYDLAGEGFPVFPWLWYLLGCFVSKVVSLVPSLLPRSVLPLISSLYWLLFSVIWRPSLGGSTSTSIFLYIVFGGFLSVILDHIGTKPPLFFLYRWPGCGWINQLHYMWVWFIIYSICMGRANHVLVILPSMVCHYSLSFLIGCSLVHFRSLGCIGSPVAVSIQSRHHCPYPVAISDHSMTFIHFLTQFGCNMDTWSSFSSYNSFSIM